MPMPYGPHASQKTADKLWPKSDVVKGYNRVFDLLDAGKNDAALALVRNLVDKPLIMAPDSALIDTALMGDYEMGRQIPLFGGFREISRRICQKADEFSKSGHAKDALDLLSVDIHLSRQIAHARPHDLINLLVADVPWRSAWERVAKILAASGDTARAASAKQYSDRDKGFLEQRVKPYTDRSDADEKSMERRTEGMSDTQSKPLWSQYLKSQQTQAVKLISMWDKEVDSPSCDRLLRP
jgi:hypothetical protein